MIFRELLITGLFLVALLLLVGLAFDLMRWIERRGVKEKGCARFILHS